MSPLRRSKRRNQVGVGKRGVRSKAKRQKPKIRSAVIEYHGSSGSSRESLRAITTLLQTSLIEKARLLTSPVDKGGNHGHGFFLETYPEGYIIILPGFASGYGGSGPACLSQALAFLENHDVHADNLELSKEQYERLEQVCLTNDDIDKIVKNRRSSGVHPTDYIWDRDIQRDIDNTLWLDVDPFLSYGLLDPRLIKVAQTFRKDPDKALLDAYRDLEEIIAKRSKLQTNGRALMAGAFMGPSPKLTWKNLKDSEIEGRGFRFVSFYLAYRNRRVHRRPKTWGARAESMSELLAVNELFRLESQAVPKRGRKKKPKH